ncbi:hypothetical protein ACTMUQ_33690 [Streptomyces sp. SD11]|uniref:hypothetical protein n=1 Tax=Streptomyces sp. SD11 TaxID=3452209 RepID=UPI003F888CD5
MGLHPMEVFVEKLGQEASEVLDDWLEQSLRTVRFQKWLSGGSGAKIALVHSEEKNEAKGGGRNAVLKLCPADDLTRNEFQRTKAAWQDASPMFRSHLLKPLWEPIAVPGDGMRAGNPWFMFQRLAGGSTRTIVKFSELPWSARASAYRVVTRELLQTWGRTDTKHDITVQEFLAEMLRDRLRSGDPLRTWAAALDTRLFERPEECVALPDESGGLVNPFLLAKENRWGRSVLRRAFMGKAHGDLNLDNVLVPTSGGGHRRFMLIDLARYSEAAPLARDPAQFLLCVVASRLAEPDCDSVERTALLRVLTDPDSRPGSMVPAQVWKVVSAYRQVVPEWAESQLDEWAENRCLSLVACALMFCGRKGVPDQDRMWFLRLAAHAATYYFTELEEEAVKEPVKDTQAESAPTVIAETTEAGPGSEANVVHVDFERRHEARRTRPSAGAAAEAAYLVDRLNADADDLWAEVTSLDLSAHGQDLDIQATMSRCLMDGLTEATHELDALRVQDSTTGQRGLIGYTETLGALKRQVEVTQQQIRLLGDTGSGTTEPLRVRLAVETLRQVTSDLRAAVDRLR